RREQTDPGYSIPVSIVSRAGSGTPVLVHPGRRDADRGVAVMQAIRMKKEATSLERLPADGSRTRSAASRTWPGSGSSSSPRLDVGDRQRQHVMGRRQAVAF